MDENRANGQRRKWARRVAAFLPVGLLVAVCAVVHGFSFARCVYFAAPQRVHDDIAMIAGAIERVARDHGGRFPPSVDEVAQPHAGRGCALAKFALDPWWNPHGYGQPLDARDGRIHSLGGAGKDSDIDSGTIEER
jgi:hypothetical protein